MSRVAGPLLQVGLIVRDVDQALAYWTQVLDVGPFYVIREARIGNFFYRGRPSEDIVITMAFAQSGEMQIELIQQHNDAPSGYREFLSAGREGAQHLSSWFEDPAAYDEARTALLGRGMQVVHETVSNDGSPRFAYFDSGVPFAPMIELSEAMLPGARIVQDTVIAASRGWDGTDPIREMRFG